MVYVFGLNVPLLELLLIFFVILLVCLGFILVELKKLRSIIVEERGVVKQFEADLERFESQDGKVHNNELEAYVQAALGRGMKPDDIKEVLSGRGWNGDMVEKVLDSVIS